MTLGPTAFAVVLWGSVFGVLVVLGYLVHTLVVDAGWADGAAPPGSGE